jgi:putative hydrolase of the HAD superfamily
LGGVIFDIDYHRTERAFISLGIKNFHELFSQAKQSHLFDEFEKGLISPEDFRNKLRILTGLAMTDNEIDDAWNAILIDVPTANVDFLKNLKKRYRLFLLSNTNAIHETAFMPMIVKKYGSYIFEELFEKIYLSHHIHLRKPDKEIFLHVINENHLVPEETLFIDDSPQHVGGAKAVGLQALWLEKGKKITDLKFG